MSDKHTGSAIHREFELERMILFSDAVFAIAITLLVIEIKFPEVPDDHHAALDLLKTFRPVMADFLAFALSFFFIGTSWARHLKMFRYLKSYNNRVIALNLFSLFFIVSFPFATSGVTHLRPSLMFPMFIYLGNLCLIAVSNLMLAHYIFKTNPSLTISGHPAEKKFIYQQNVVMAAGLLVTFTATIVTGFLTGADGHAISLCLDVCVVLMLVARRWLKSQKPESNDAL